MKSDELQGKVSNDTDFAKTELVMGFLTDFDRHFMSEAILEAAMAEEHPSKENLNGELMQLENTITHLIKARRNALVNMEPPTSRYILELEKKIVEKATRRDELTALLAERDQAA